MAERSLADALTLTPEKIQFVKNDKNDVFAETHSRSHLEDKKMSTVEATLSVGDGRRVRRPVDTAPVQQHVLVSVTTRLQQDTASALRKAYLEQKLNGRYPDTQQEIIEEALQHWLYERGFLS